MYMANLTMQSQKQIQWLFYYTLNFDKQWFLVENSERKRSQTRAENKWKYHSTKISGNSFSNIY
jgi:hypothetical protein